MSRSPRRVVKLLLAALVVLVLPAASAQADVPSHTFSYTGSTQTWTVPDGVTTITIQAEGASGGNPCYSGAGGSGAGVTGTLPVTPGDVVNIVVGGHGGDCGSPTPGWGGSTYDGGYGGVSQYDGSYNGGGGGGASAVLLSGAPVVVAGGGGGGSYDQGAGGDSATDASDPCCYGAGGGKAGTASAAGAGGAAGYFGGSAGSSGVDGVGGSGGTAQYYGAGGGGGGYHGGGGGGGAYYYSGGGGGGADFTAAAVGAPATADGDHAGDGQVVIYEGVLPPAPAQRQALIDSSTVSGGGTSQEAQIAKNLGYKVTLVSDAKWGSMTADDFGKYDLLIVGDPACSGLPSGVVNNAAAYGAAVMGTGGGRTAAGNRVLVGTDPVFHDGGDFTSANAWGTVIRTGIAFAGTQTGTTGIYFDASCSGGQSLSVLPQLSAGDGSWTANGGPPCGGSVSVIASNPAFADLTTDSLQGWGCSVHETFPTFPSDWSALAVATDTDSKPTCGVDPNTGASACGESYVLIAGSGIVLTSGSISVTPTDSTSAAGGDHTVTAHVTSGDSALVGQAVTFTVTGQNAGATGTCVPADCTSDANGDVSFKYHDDGGAGDDTIKASFKDARGSLQAATAQHHWTAGPVDQPISATGTTFGATEGVALSGQKVASFSDPDTSTSASQYSATIDWGDGETSTGTITGDAGSFDVSGDHTYADEGSAPYTVTVTVTDSTDTTHPATATSSATVADAAPTVKLDSSNDQSVNEGSTHTYRYTATDYDESVTVDASCGANGTKVAETASSFDCSFADGPASSDVSVAVSNSDGTAGNSDAQTVHVNNVAPTVTLSSSNPSSVPESKTGRTFTYSISDPGKKDTVQSVATSCGSGSQKTGESNTDSSGSFTCVFVHGPASPTVSVSATDSDGDTGNTDTQNVSVTDPAISASGSPVSGVETVAFSGQKVASFSDPTAYETADAYTASISWGDGSSSHGTITKTGDGQFDVTGSHTYGDEGSYAVKVTVTDADNAANSATATSTATVADAPIHASGVAAITTAQAFSGSVATFTDEANGPKSDFSATVDWGDGSSSAGTISGPDASGKFTVSGSHTYTITGPVTITVKVTDVGGSTDTATTSALVYAFATPAGGSFTISDKQAAAGGTVTYWAAQWEKANPFSSGLTGSASYKGYIQPNAAKTAPTCGSTWTSGPGDSSVPPTSVPAYMAVVVASKESKSGSSISGDVKRIVVVKTAAGYTNDPGHAGTGTIVGSVC